MVPWFPLLGLTPSGSFMGSVSTLIYTSELILCFPILENSSNWPFVTSENVLNSYARALKNTSHKECTSWPEPHKYPTFANCNTRSGRLRVNQSQFWNRVPLFHPLYLSFCFFLAREINPLCISRREHPGGNFASFFWRQLEYFLSPINYVWEMEGSFSALCMTRLGFR